MPDFSNYEDRDRRRGLLFTTAAAASIAAVAIPASRRGLVRGVLSGAEAIGARFGQYARPLAALSRAREINSMYNRGIERVAKLSIGGTEARRVLATEFRKMGASPGGRPGILTSERADEYADRVLNAGFFRRFLMGRGTDASKLTFSEDVNNMLRDMAARTASARGMDTNVAYNLAHNQFLEILNKAKLAAPGEIPLANQAVYQRTRQRFMEMSRNELKYQSQWQYSRSAKVMKAFGVTPVTVGDPSVAGTAAEITERLRFLATEGTPAFDDLMADVNAIRVGGMYRVGDRVYDLRRFQAAIHRGHEWISQNVQIPLAPGLEGISPGRLFPWLRGSLSKRVAHISTAARDPQLRAVLGGAPGEGIGEDVFRVGNKYMSVDFAGGSVRDLDIEGELKSGLWGFFQNRTKEVEKALEARAAGNSWFQRHIGSFFGQSDPSNFTRFASTFTKYSPESNWAPRVFGRLFTGDAAEISVGDVKRAVSILTDAEIPASVRQQMIDRAIDPTNPLFGKTYVDIIRNIENDQAVIDFFTQATKSVSEGVSPGFKSHKLVELVNQAHNNFESVFSRYKPGTTNSAFSEFPGLGMNLNPFGKPLDKTGLSLMREAIYDELEEAIAQAGAGGLSGASRLGGFTSFVQGLKGVSATDRRAALAFGHGKVLGRVLQEANADEAATAAAGWLRRDPETEKLLRGYTASQHRPWHTFVAPEDPFLGTSELFSRRTQTPADLLRNINETWKNTGSPFETAKSALNSPFVRQFGAFFTGNQADVTNATVAMEYFPRRLNDLFRGVHLGLSDRDLLSGGSIMKGLFLKRIFPAVAAYETYRYLDYVGGEHGPSDIYANLRSRAALTRARLTGGEIVGVGKRELFPGLEKFLPDRTVEEELQHQESGFEPVRKGRFWSIGSREEFWGGKIDYFLPSAVRVSRSDWQGASNVDLNTRDYWKHSWLPNPSNMFLGPIASLFDQYWWERKHAEGPLADRPYPVSAEKFDPNTLHGTYANALLGWLKPRRVLQPDLVPERLGGSATAEDIRRINKAVQSGADLGGLGDILGSGHGARGLGSYAVQAAGGQVGGSEQEYGIPGVVPRGGKEIRGGFLRVSPAGMIKPLTMRAEGITDQQYAQMGKSTIQKEGRGARLSRREIERINRLTEAGMGSLSTLSAGALNRLATQRAPFSEADMDMLDYQSGMITGIRNLRDVMGLYGWMTEVALPLKQEGPILPTPQRAMGYNRRFYELAIGGLGEDLSEVGRRFMPKAQKFQEWNPIPNRMPSWLPGAEYFIDFRHGDPYTKVSRGELRLPGEAYERTHNVKVMQMRASGLGKTPEEMMQSMLFIGKPMSEFGEDITEIGNRIHRTIQNRWKRMGVLIAAEDRIYNEQLGISGHFDALIRTKAGPEVAEIKSMGSKRFAEGKRRPFEEHLAQLNFYLHEMGLQRGQLVYVNRDAPDQVFVHNVRYDERRFQQSIAKVQEARRQLREMEAGGVINRGDLYDPITRFEILSDVAPYSENYLQLREYLTSRNKEGNLTEEDNDRFQSAKKRVARYKKRVETFAYRFRGTDLDTKSYTVDKIIDPNTFTVKESPNPIRLAGVRSSQARIAEVYGPAPEGMTLAEHQFAQFGIRPGSRLKVQVEGDPEKRVADDTLRTQHAVVYGKGGNVNLQLIRSGAGTEKETDYSDTGVAARFTDKERRIGSVWEWFAHLDTPLNTKFLKVRSPLEELERGIVFGKNTGSWNHPFRDYIFPTISSYASKNPIVAAGAMGIWSTFFMGSRVGKIKAFKYGAVTGAALSLARMGYEMVTGEVWKPARTRRREELEEYWDVLKYTKFRGLAQHYQDRALTEEGTDIDKIARQIFIEGEQRKTYLHSLERRKRELKKNADPEQDPIVKEIQAKINKLGESSYMEKLGPNALMALTYREAYRSTLYGIDPSDSPFINVFKAFPKYKRELLTGFIENSSQKERERIFSLLPDAEKRVIAPYLGIDKEKVPTRPKLRDYFKRHPLPGPEWEGWRPDVDLEALRLRAIGGERLDPFESGLYPVQIENAEDQTRTVAVPTLKGSSRDVQANLNQILSGKGLKNVSVRVEEQPWDGKEDDLQIYMDIRQRREQEIRNRLQLGG